MSRIQSIKPHSLPAPNEIAKAHSERLSTQLRALIGASESAALSFADFMRALLYAPGLGYYTAGAAKIGHAGDFVTAPEISSLFAEALADVLVNSRENSHAQAASKVLELGAGTGKLAFDFINAALGVDYSILDVSADLRERQQMLLAGKNVRWLDTLPEAIEGIVIANEVLDAVPCELVRFQAGVFEQAFVVWQENAFAWAWRPIADAVLKSAAEARLPQIDGYSSEINLEAEALVRSLAARLVDGPNSALCFIDYGFPRREYYFHGRKQGTLACHYQQRVHFDPFMLPGIQDVTAHVDFTAMAEVAVDAGASVALYAAQAPFLLHAGILQGLQKRRFATEAERISATGAVQKLLSPAEMGELFKVLIVTKSAGLETFADLAVVDQSYRL